MRFEQGGPQNPHDIQFTPDCGDAKDLKVLRLGAKSGNFVGSAYSQGLMRHGSLDHLVGKCRGQARSTARRLRSASEQWPRAPS
jgi:hypothetical protein